MKVKKFVLQIEAIDIYVRCVDISTICINEDFLEFEVADNLTGECLLKKIVQLIEKLGLEKQYLVGQGYDGSVAMSEQLKGVQKYITYEVP